MDYRFNAEEWSGLSTQDRVRRCRLMAEEALKLAGSASPELKASYIAIAHDWQKLAGEIEAAATKEGGTTAAP